MFLKVRERGNLGSVRRQAEMGTFWGKAGGNGHGKQGTEEIRGKKNPKHLIRGAKGSETDRVWRSG